jgi:hypothetical protein
VFELEYLVGLRVSRITIGSGVTLELSSGTGAADESATLDAGPVKYESRSVSIIELDQSENVGTRYAPLLALYGCEITSARADEKANILELVFATGERFTALPMRDVEGWQLTGPGNRLMVAVPGGDVAAWG